MRVVAPFIAAGPLFYFQRRSPDRRRGAAGMIGTFGGKVEPGETDRRAAVREVAEETTLRVTEASLQPLGSYRVVSDYELRPVSVDMVAFLLDLAPPADFRATDGELVVLAADEVPRHLAEMTPGTRTGWEMFLAARYL